MAKSFYKAQWGKRTDGVPLISSKLDSIRSFQFEVQFFNVPTLDVDEADYTLAAKSVGPVGFTVDDIPVDRVNDKVFYPGKPSPEEVTITFDNLLAKDTTGHLYLWFQSTYNPATGALAGGDFKCDKMTILTLDGTANPTREIQLFGVYPKSFKTSEFNYSTNEFHTIEVSFRYDMMNVGVATNTFGGG